MRFSHIALIFFAAYFFLNLGDGVIAQTKSPFGVSAPQAPAPVGGDFLRENLSWIYQQQAAFYKELTGIVRQAKEDGSAVWGLILLSFLYGIFHAAGPGHGKIIISTYMLANEASARRGVIISFLASFMQGLVAVLLIGVAVFFLNLTSFGITEATSWFERASYALLMMLGVYLLWQKGVQPYLNRRPLVIQHAAGGNGHHHAHAHAHAHTHDLGHGHNHSHAHGHSHHSHDDHACSCGGHAANPSELKDPLDLQSAWAAILSVGLRPCSGALIVLVFAASQGLFMVGVVSTFAMALGTAITVTTLAIMALGAKGFATMYLAGSNKAGWVFKSVELFGASLVFLLGATLLAASLQAG